MEIPHDFFLITLGNSTSFLIDPWNFYMFFPQYPWKFHVLNPPCLDFLWNSPLSIPQVSGSPVISKINNLIYDWVLLKELLNATQKLQNSHGLPKGFSSPLRTKISNIKKYVELKTLLSTKKIEQEFKTNKNNLLKLTSSQKNKLCLNPSKPTFLVILTQI